MVERNRSFFYCSIYFMLTNKKISKNLYTMQYTSFIYKLHISNNVIILT